MWYSTKPHPGCNAVPCEAWRAMHHRRDESRRWVQRELPAGAGSSRCGAPLRHRADKRRWVTGAVTSVLNFNGNPEPADKRRGESGHRSDHESMNSDRAKHRRKDLHMGTEACYILGCSSLPPQALCRIPKILWGLCFGLVPCCYSSDRECRQHGAPHRWKLCEVFIGRTSESR